MSEWHYGDMVAPDYDPAREHAMMVIAIRHDCPFHPDPPCLVLMDMKYNPPDLGGWCYTTDAWTKLDEGR